MMRLALSLLSVALMLSVVGLAPAPVAAQQVIQASLDGYQETPSISTRGNGIFRATIAADLQSISYLLVYFDLEASVLFAHIHLGQAGTAGGVAAFLCGGGGKPACPAPGVVTFTGTLTAADVSTIAAQGLTAGEFSEFVRAIQGGNAYVNVHTQTFTGGEIRGQLK